jgi:hypothetical protein
VNRECRDGLDPNEQDPIAGGGGEGSQMAVLGAKQPFLFELPTFVKLRGSEYLFFCREVSKMDTRRKENGLPSPAGSARGTDLSNSLPFMFGALITFSDSAVTSAAFTAFA